MRAVERNGMRRYWPHDPSADVYAEIALFLRAPKDTQVDFSPPQLIACLARLDRIDSVFIQLFVPIEHRSAYLTTSDDMLASGNTPARMDTAVLRWFSNPPQGASPRAEPSRDSIPHLARHPITFANLDGNTSRVTSVRDATELLFHLLFIGHMPGLSYALVIFKQWVDVDFSVGDERRRPWTTQDDAFIYAVWLSTVGGRMRTMSKAFQRLVTLLVCVYASRTLVDSGGVLRIIDSIRKLHDRDGLEESDDIVPALINAGTLDVFPTDRVLRAFDADTLRRMPQLVAFFMACDQHGNAVAMRDILDHMVSTLVHNPVLEGPSVLVVPLWSGFIWPPRRTLDGAVICDVLRYATGRHGQYIQFVFHDTETYYRLIRRAAAQDAEWLLANIPLTYAVADVHNPMRNYNHMLLLEIARADFGNWSRAEDIYWRLFRGADISWELDIHAVGNMKDWAGCPFLGGQMPVMSLDDSKWSMVGISDDTSKYSDGILSGRDWNSVLNIIATYLRGNISDISPIQEYLSADTLRPLRESRMGNNRPILPVDPTLLDIKLLVQHFSVHNITDSPVVMDLVRHLDTVAIYLPTSLEAAAYKSSHGWLPNVPFSLTAKPLFGQ